MANDSYRILCTRWELTSEARREAGFLLCGPTAWDDRWQPICGLRWRAPLAAWLDTGAPAAAARLIGETFPWGTIIVNIVGSFIIGFFATLTGPDGRIFADTLTRQFSS